MRARRNTELRRAPLTLLLVPCLAAMACPRRAPMPAGPPAVTLAFTSHVRGWVEPCGCTADPLGGIHRIHAELARMRAAGPVLFFDTGSLLFDRMEIPAAAQCQEEARVRLLVRAAGASGLALTGLGPFDLSRGEAFRAQTLGGAGLPVVTANVEGAGGVVARTVKEAGGVRVGFTGATWPADAGAPAGDNTVTWHGLTLRNPESAVRAQVAALRADGAHVVVVLSQMPRARSVALLGAVEGIDVLVQGHEPGEEPTTPLEVVPGSWLVSAGQQGQYLARLHVTLPAPGGARLAFDDGGRAARAQAEHAVKRAQLLEDQAADFAARGDTANADARRHKAQQLRAAAATPASATQSNVTVRNTFRFDALPLTRQVAGDPTVEKELLAYKASLRALNLECEKNITCPPPPPGAQAYVGTLVCAECHQEAYEQWKGAVVNDGARAGALGHARAWKTLQDKDATGNRDCVGCHSVGFELPGGTCKVSEAPKWGNVGCETCHGPGSRHAETEEKADIRLSPGEEGCRECHRVPHIPTTESFVYADRLRHVLGPGHGAAALQNLSPGAK
ncbi:MAG: hypothetical protein HY904_16210 [Deltaproteobacteria bacterium]|nr:hypothetical protein [Deltaproteobacteria bacterium]